MYSEWQDAAITDFSIVLKKDFRNYLAFHNRGVCKKALDMDQQSIQDFTKAIELKPDFFKSYNTRGTAYLDLKDYEAAHRDLKRAVELSPGNPAVLFNLAEYYNEVNDQASARRQF